MESVGVLKLRKPLLVNGVDVTEIPYDFDALTVMDITEADKYRQEEAGLPALYPGVDRATQFELFARAVEKSTNEVGREDIQRLGAKDGMRAMLLARDFFNAADDDQEEAPREEETAVEGFVPSHGNTYQSEDCEDGEGMTSL